MMLECYNLNKSSHNSAFQGQNKNLSTVPFSNVTDKELLNIILCHPSFLHNLLGKWETGAAFESTLHIYMLIQYIRQKDCTIHKLESQYFHLFFSTESILRQTSK